MKNIYQFTWNYKTYRSTSPWDLLDFAADIFGLTVWTIFDLKAVGESDTEIQLERVN